MCPFIFRDNDLLLAYIVMKVIISNNREVLKDPIGTRVVWIPISHVDMLIHYTCSGAVGSFKGTTQPPLLWALSAGNSSL